MDSQDALDHSDSLEIGDSMDFQAWMVKKEILDHKDVQAAQVYPDFLVGFSCVQVFS